MEIYMHIYRITRILTFVLSIYHLGNESMASSYAHFTSGPQPDLNDFNEDYNQYGQNFKKWINQGYSQLEKDSTETKKKYCHLAEFSVQQVNANDKGKIPHTTLVTARRYFMDGTNHRTEVATYNLIFPHLKKQIVSIEKDNDVIYLDMGMLHHPLKQKVVYVRPGISEITALKDELQYTHMDYILAGQEINTLALLMKNNGIQSQNLQDGAYRIKSIQLKQSPFFFSSGRELFLTRHCEAWCEYSNDTQPREYSFTYTIPTKHKISLKSGYVINNPTGFFPEGLYEKKLNNWYKLGKDFKPISGEQAYQITYKGPSFIEDIALDPAETNMQIIRDLQYSAELPVILKLGLSGRSFSEEEQKSLASLLRKMANLEVLNLSKKEDGIKYTSLVDIIGLLSRLKKLNIENCGIEDSDIRKFPVLSQIELINTKKPVVAAPTPVQVPVPVEKPKPAPLTLVSVQYETTSHGQPHKVVRGNNQLLIRHETKREVKYWSNGNKTYGASKTVEHIIQNLGEIKYTPHYQLSGATGKRSKVRYTAHYPDGSTSVGNWTTYTGR